MPTACELALGKNKWKLLIQERVAILKKIIAGEIG